MPHPDEVLGLMAATAPPASVAVGASPFTYTAPDRGVLVLQGGTVSLVELGRKGTFVTTGLTTAVLNVSKGDQVRVTYAVLPTLTFFKG
jgi:2-keto-4-pentenoate hydratase